VKTDTRSRPGNCSASAYSFSLSFVVAPGAAPNVIEDSPVYL
jgi:hypothetical protein